ncbi:uncharacterized protein LOC120324229 [Pipra filicauda]|uniref:Uncharacterized protein LOC120324229 n=1 Tax=Pipra filicauda TaxID=649802 RepID=A0A7R5KYG7_9PASS|nr:uncharacterized protein LOC120324229 [Pipra filicauda]
MLTKPRRQVSHPLVFNNSRDGDSQESLFPNTDTDGNRQPEHNPDREGSAGSSTARRLRTDPRGAGLSPGTTRAGRGGSSRRSGSTSLCSRSRPLSPETRSISGRQETQNSTSAWKQEVKSSTWVYPHKSTFCFRTRLEEKTRKLQAPSFSMFHKLKSCTVTCLFCLGILTPAGNSKAGNLLGTTTTFWKSQSSMVLEDFVLFPR